MTNPEDMSLGNDDPRNPQAGGVVIGPESSSRAVVSKVGGELIVEHPPHAYKPVWKRCIMCDGKGEYRRFEPLPAPDDPDGKATRILSIQCPKCSGEGYLPTKELFIKITY